MASRWVWVLFVLAGVQMVLAQAPPATPAAPEAAVVIDIPYRTEPLDDYARQRCKLDLVVPKGKTGYPVVVWFYGGALEGGAKEDQWARAIARRLVSSGIGMVLPNYRLSPKVTYPAYVEDAAASVGWVMAHIAEYGGDPKRVYISGHSAGGYLATLICMDPSYLAQVGVKLSDIAGAIPVSAQVFTHFTIRKERGLPNPQATPTIDDAAPGFHVRKDAPPILMVFGDRDWPARAEENRYFVAMLHLVGHPDAACREFSNRNHSTIITEMAKPDDPLLLAFLEFIAGHPKAK